MFRDIKGTKKLPFQVECNLCSSVIVLSKSKSHAREKFDHGVKHVELTTGVRLMCRNCHTFFPCLRTMCSHLMRGQCARLLGVVSFPKLFQSDLELMKKYSSFESSFVYVPGYTASPSSSVLFPRASASVNADCDNTSKTVCNSIRAVKQFENASAQCEPSDFAVVTGSRCTSSQCSESDFEKTVVVKNFSSQCLENDFDTDVRLDDNRVLREEHNNRVDTAGDFNISRSIGRRLNCIILDKQTYRETLIDSNVLYTDSEEPIWSLVAPKTTLGERGFPLPSGRVERRFYLKLNDALRYYYSAFSDLPSR